AHDAAVPDPGAVRLEPRRRWVHRLGSARKALYRGSFYRGSVRARIHVPARSVSPGSSLMRVHILGICGTFMAGIAALAKAAGHQVSGSDQNVYPPMSTQLRKLGIRLHEGYGPEQLDDDIDCVVVGNVLRRGYPVIEALLDSGIPYYSGAEWLADNVLKDKW